MAHKQLDLRTTPKQKRTLEKRLKIHAACMDLLGELGLEKLNTNENARRAEINIGSLYKLYPNKYAILNDMALAFSAQQNDALIDYINSLGPDATVEDLLIGLIDVLVDLIERYPGNIALQEALVAIPELREQYQQSNLSIVSAMAVFLRARGLRLGDAEMVRTVVVLGETWATLSRLALKPDRSIDREMIDEIKFIHIAYIRAKLKACPTA